MQYQAILINGGTFGKRVKRELEKNGLTKVLLIEQNKELRRANAIAKTLFHAAATSVQRRDYYYDYAISIPQELPDWEILRTSIRAKLKQANECEGIEPDEIWTEEVQIDQTTVKIAEQTYQTDILILIKKEIAKVKTTFDNLYLSLLDKERLPKRWVLLGEDQKTVEAASILADLGCKVYIVSESPTLLPSKETNLQENIKSILLDKGVSIFLQTKIKQIDTVADRQTLVILEANEIEQQIQTIEYILKETTYSLTEQKLDTGKYIEICSPETRIGRAETDLLQILIPNLIWPKSKFFAIPTFIYTNPAAAYVGYTEEEARNHNYLVRTSNPRFRGLFYSVCKSKIPTDYKLVIATEEKDFIQEEKVIGIHLFGTSSCDIIKGFAIAMYCEISPEELLKTLPIHPTSAEELITG
ncbi:glutathione reductase (NADPH) [Nematocida homosporus]|uniref:glutathione reductase (NADPH) n=1 Tax=Nematocida homosporus TaxID=1912981 RepID=UPI00221EBA9F|nr:glutathione reductase (NADPH) [Nematocida homosporus]KAI5186747.1 glutathione reductase (NADPH) [Nematocida homosporus]